MVYITLIYFGDIPMPPLFSSGPRTVLRAFETASYDHSVAKGQLRPSAPG